MIPLQSDSMRLPRLHQIHNFYVTNKAALLDRWTDSSPILGNLLQILLSRGSGKKPLDLSTRPREANVSSTEAGILHPASDSRHPWLAQLGSVPRRFTTCLSHPYDFHPGKGGIQR